MQSSSTTAPSTTTDRPGGDVLVDPYLPVASSRSEVPWSEVGPGWHVVLYDSSKADPMSEAEVRDGSAVLYLVDPSGGLYEVGAWGLGTYPTLVDATAASALIVRTGATVDDTSYEVVDLVSGTVSKVYELGWPETSYINTWPAAALTRPTGANAVVIRSDGSNEWLERRSPDGSVLATVYTQPLAEGSRSLAWLYAPDGMSLVVGHSGGLAAVANDGMTLDELWAPQDTWCRPVRWWDADTFLAACYGEGPESAPADEYGDPATWYGRLWLLETDGSAGFPLTEFPPDPPIVVDFGYHDAWPTASDTYLQWSGDCGASKVATLAADGTGSFLEVALPADLIADGVSMVDIVDGRIAIYGWQGCDGWVGSLFTVDLDGGSLDMLIPVIGDARGVIGVIGLADVYP
jgi:TolB protein